MTFGFDDRVARSVYDSICQDRDRLEQDFRDEQRVREKLTSVLHELADLLHGGPHPEGGLWSFHDLKDVLLLDWSRKGIGSVDEAEEQRLVEDLESLSSLLEVLSAGFTIGCPEENRQHARDRAEDLRARARRLCKGNGA